MGTREIICRLCLNICDSFKALEGNMKGFLDKLLPRISLVATQESMICTHCAEMLEKCYDFKVMCLNGHDNMISSDHKKNVVELNLIGAPLNSNESNSCVQQAQDECGFCKSLVKDCIVSFLVERGDVVLEKMIQQCLPELDLSIVKRSAICTPCRESLETCFRFITNCLTVEEKIKRYCESHNINSSDLIELNSVLQFTIRELDGNSVGTIKTEREFCEGGTSSDMRETTERYNVFKLEQMAYDSENANEELEHRNGNGVNMTDLKFNREEQNVPKSPLVGTKESYNLDIVKIEETFCRENEIKEEVLVDMEDQKFLVNENIEIKTDEPEFYRYEAGVVLPHLEDAARLQRRWECLTPDLGRDLSTPYTNHTLDHSEVTTYKCDSSFQTMSTNGHKMHSVMHKDPSEVTMYQCDSCSFQTKFRGVLRNHLLLHKDSSEVAIYKCNSCPYQAKVKAYIERHLLIHKDPSEVKMYKCDSCSFQARHKSYLKCHALKHKDSSEVAVFKCDSCSFESKWRGGLKKHLLRHIDPSELTMHKCDFCSYQTKLKGNLKKHLLQHSDHSKATQMHKCDFCSFQTKLKGCLKRHLLLHKDPSEVTMYKCDFCSFQTKLKGNLKYHLLKHKSISEVTAYTCPSCPYQTKHRGNLKQHLLKHEDPSILRTYRCDSCSFQTISSVCLSRHLLVHKDKSEVTMYKCNSCSFETKRKSYLKTHSYVHKDPSEAAMHQCNYCPFQTSRSMYLKRHLIMHMDPSEVTMYKCDVCSLQTKYKASLKKHLLKHNDVSELTMFKCDSCSYQAKSQTCLTKHLLIHRRSPTII